LHGRVQANLTAAILLLQRTRAEYAASGILDVRLIDQVRDAMQAAWQVDSRSPGSASDRLERVAGVWAGIMPVRLVLGDAARARLDADHDSGDAGVEVVRELLLNAARHGGATGAEVAIDAADSDLVRIRVRETGGRAVADQPQGTGMGGTMIDSVADRWWVQVEGPERVTTVLLPTGLSPSAVQRNLTTTE
jgi:anti-sigma regulatory factor (Ser/Thr protein kinase)